LDQLNLGLKLRFRAEIDIHINIHGGFGDGAITIIRCIGHDLNIIELAVGGEREEGQLN